MPNSRSNNLTLDLSRPDDRHFFVGKTGSGKTYLVRYLLEKMHAKGWPVAIVDSPDNLWYGKDGEPPKKGKGTVLQPRLVEKYDPRWEVQLYQPPSTEGWSDPQLIQFMTDCFEHGNMIIDFDELLGIVDMYHIPMIFQQLWAQGRKINLSAWCCTQRPKRIPDIVKSQAENVYCFQMFNAEDRKLMAGYLNNPVAGEIILPERYFWYRGRNMPVARLARPIEVK